MKNTFYVLASCIIIALSAFSMLDSKQWLIQEGYEVKFTSKDPTGIFKTVKGEIHFDQDDLANSSFNMLIDPASINTGNGMQNKHAMSDKWLDVEQFPEITFKSTDVKKTASGYEAIGKLNMHGVENDLTIPFTFSENIFHGTFKISRMDYGMDLTEGKAGSKTAQILEVEVTMPVSEK